MTSLRLRLLHQEANPIGGADAGGAGQLPASGGVMGTALDAVGLLPTLISSGVGDDPDFGAGAGAGAGAGLPKPLPPPPAIMRADVDDAGRPRLR